MRDIEKQESTCKETLNNIGVNNPEAPLLKLADALKSLKDIPKTSDGKPVVPNCFDPYRFSLVSPDHVFLGLITNALELFLKLLKPSERHRFDKRLTNILKHNGLFGRSTILNSEKSIMKTTISETFAILFATPIAIKCCEFFEKDLFEMKKSKDTKCHVEVHKKVINTRNQKSNNVADELLKQDIVRKERENPNGREEVRKEDNDMKRRGKTMVRNEVQNVHIDKSEMADREVTTDASMKHKALSKAVELLTELNSIVIESQRNPKSHRDRVEVMRSFNDCNGRTRLIQLMKRVKKHCETIEELSEIDPDSVAILDKPNMHRFVELFTHTLTLFGSLKYVEELIMEKGHQGAKRAVDMSNKKNEQIQAMMVYIHDDFVSRLRSITRDKDVPKCTDWQKNLSRLCRRQDLSLIHISEPTRPY